MFAKEQGGSETVSVYLQQPEKFIGCVMASYRSMLSATSTYVDAYVTHTWTKRISLQATFPANQEIVIRCTMSVRTLSKPTLRSVGKKTRDKRVEGNGRERVK